MKAMTLYKILGKRSEHNINSEENVGKRINHFWITEL